MNYEEALEFVLKNGVKKPPSRPGQPGTVSWHGLQLRYDLREGFPLITSRTIYFKSVVRELLWFLSGSTDIRDLWQMDCHIWDQWQRDNKEYDLGPIYGEQWRKWGFRNDRLCAPGSECGTSSVDQLAQVLMGLRESPYSRRHLVSAWNPDDVPFMALPPCHFCFQFTVEPNEEGNPHWLNIHVMQRSWDLPVGAPYNLASYGLLLCLVAHEVGLKPKWLVYSATDAHIYEDQILGVVEQLRRSQQPLPQFSVNQHIELNLKEMRAEIPDPRIGDVPELNPAHFVANGRACGPKKHGQQSLFRILNYNPHPSIEYPVAK